MTCFRWGHVSAYIAPVYMVCGGSTEQYGTLAPNNTCDMYNVADHQWQQMEDMTQSRHQVTVSSFSVTMILVTKSRN